MKALSICIFILIIHIKLYASEASLYELQLQTLSTSDQYSIDTLSLNWRSSRRNLFWSYKGAYESSDDLIIQMNKRKGDFRADINAADISIGYGKKWNFGNYTEFNIGLHELEYIASSRTYKVNIKHDYIYNKRLNITALINRDFFYIEKGITTPLANKLKNIKLGLSSNYRPKENFRILTKINTNTVSDSNKFNQFSLISQYGTVYPTWFWIGYGAELLKFKNNTSDYWSPNNFTAHGPRLEISRTVFEKLALGTSINYSFIKEDDFESGNSTYITGTISYGDRNDFLISLQYIDNRSQQGASEWSSESIVLKCQYSL